MKRGGKILALLMLLIYVTASAGSSAAALLCRHHCHCQHIHHSEECVCHGYSFEMPCDGHHHVQYAGAYADRIENSRQTHLSSFIVIPVVVSGTVDEVVCPDAGDADLCPIIDTPPLCKAYCRVSAMRAPPAWV